MFTTRGVDPSPHLILRTRAWLAVARDVAILALCLALLVGLLAAVWNPPPSRPVAHSAFAEAVDVVSRRGPSERMVRQRALP
jgi:hypothetical protein